MHIGVDATCWHNTRGYGRHARALLSALVRLDTENRYTFFTDATDNSQTLPPEADVELVCATAPTAFAAASSGHRSLRDMWRMSRAMSAPGYDLLFFPTVYSYVPVFGGAKKVVMIHDIIAEKYPRLTLPSYSARLFWRVKTALGRWQADAIATVSDYSRMGIVEHFKIPAERVFVVGEASDPVFRVLDDPQLTPTLNSVGIKTTGRTVVYVGGFGPHKNLEMLVAVFARLVAKREFSDTSLVMVGEYKKEVFHSYFGVIKRQIEDLGLGGRVIFTGYLPDEELVVLLNLATVLVLPSLMEGFGLPAVEAAACGCPVIATTASPLPKLLGDGSLYINPSKPEDLEMALICVLKSDSVQVGMRRAGLAAARKLTWDAAAWQMINLIHKVTAG
jgi:glycosyltransferase involved in cell wall biosynthesis